MTTPSQPIDTAPTGDGWILGFAGPAERFPWQPMTRCDEGWIDDDGLYHTPTHWLPMPDPQPQPTGWSPPRGEIVVEACWIGDDRVPMFLVSIVGPDGKYDDAREPDFRQTLDQAVTSAIKWSVEIGLPWRLGGIVHAAADVVPIQQGKRR